jgi:hypothetical protein
MSGVREENSYLNFIRKGDLVYYIIELFEMTTNSGFNIIEEENLGVVVSDLIESREYNSVGGFTTLGHPSIESDSVPYFKIYCFKGKQIFFIQIDKVKIAKSK